MTDNNIDTIHSIPEYLKYLESIETIAGTTYTLGCFTFYRGQANINWGLTPSLYRQKLLKMENLLLRELNHLCPLEFMNNRFDTLVKMQHFGLHKICLILKCLKQLPSTAYISSPQGATKTMLFTTGIY